MYIAGKPWILQDFAIGFQFLDIYILNEPKFMILFIYLKTNGNTMEVY